HGSRIEAVVRVEGEVPRSWLRRSRKGMWYCTRDIPAARFLPVGPGIGASVRPHRITSPRSSQKASSPYLKTGVLYGPKSRRKRSSSVMGSRSETGEARSKRQIGIVSNGTNDRQGHSRSVAGCVVWWYGVPVALAS